MKTAGRRSLHEQLRQSLMSVWRTTFREPRNGDRFEESLIPVTGAALVAYTVIVVLTGYFFLVADPQIARAAPVFAPYGSTVRTVFEVLTMLGSSAWILVLTAMLAIGYALKLRHPSSFSEKARWLTIQADASFLFWTIACSGTLASFIKNMIGRARPGLIGEYGAYYFDFAAFTAKFASFPSGHSTTFGGLCMGLYLLFPNYRYLLLLAAAVGGSSRVIVGAHYPSDVVAGLAFGAGFVALSARWLARRGVLFRFNGSALPVRKGRPLLTKD